MSKRIVVCDDDSHIVRAVSMELRKAGFNVETARDGQEGWEAIGREVPDLVLTDYQMPRVDGIELCRRLRANPATREVPVFMLTAKGLELDAEKLRQEFGVSQVIMKPFSPRDLLRIVQESLEHVGVAL